MILKQTKTYLIIITIRNLPSSTCVIIHLQYFKIGMITTMNFEKRFGFHQYLRTYLTKLVFITDPWDFIGGAKIPGSSKQYQLWRCSLGWEATFQSHISLDIFQIHVAETRLLERIVVLLEYQLVSVWLGGNAVGILAFSVYPGALYRKVKARRKLWTLEE